MVSYLKHPAAGPFLFKTEALIAQVPQLISVVEALCGEMVVSRVAVIQTI